MKNIINTILLLILTLAFTGCGYNSNYLNSTSDIVNEIDNIDVPKAYIINSENYFDYQPWLECSAFSSAYLLRHYGEKAEGLALYENFPNKLQQGGVMPAGILEFFNGREYEAEFKIDGTVDILKKLVSCGAPVIVFIHLEEPYTTVHNTHYVPLIGYDEEYFYFAESLIDYSNCKDIKDIKYNRKTKIAEFESLWINIDGIWDNPYFIISKK